jgi:uncharacterized protein YbcC (UPF0753/DUF2309 family)
MACRLDEGLAEWETNKNQGFYNALRKLAVYDTDMPKTTISETQNKKMEALAAIMVIPQLISLKYLHRI